MSLLFARHLERRLILELTRDATHIAAGLDVDPDGKLSVVSPLPDPRFDNPAGGYYWQVSTPTATARSRSLWDAALPVPVDAPSNEWRLRSTHGPFGAPIVILERKVLFGAAAHPVVVQVAQDRKDTTSAQDDFNLELALFLAGLWGILIAAAWVQVQLGLAPLGYIRRDLEGLKANPSHRLPSPRLNELQPLTNALNDLAAAREVDLIQARGRASDLAHGLKTPLAALKAQSRRLRESGAEEAADRLERTIDAMSSTVLAELTRSRLAGQARGGAAPVLDIFEKLVQVLEQTEAGEVISFTVEAPAGLTAPLDSDDLTDLLGPLMENAVRFARRRVAVSAVRNDSSLDLSVEDDGPGIPFDRASIASGRGVRLDETDAGQGLGLSIARSYAESAGGALSLTRSLLGGLRVEISFPHRYIEQTPTATPRPLQDP